MSTFKDENLKFSFELSNIWYQYSNIILEKELSSLYRYNAIMMYYLALDTMSKIPYYENRFSLIKQLSLENLNKLVLVWASSTRKIYPLPIYLSPLILKPQKNLYLPL